MRGVRGGGVEGTNSATFNARSDIDKSSVNVLTFSLDSKYKVPVVII